MGQALVAKAESGRRSVAEDGQLLGRRVEGKNQEFKRGQVCCSAAGASVRK